jgi:cell division protein FtsQ
VTTAPVNERIAARRAEVRARRRRLRLRRTVVVAVVAAVAVGAVAVERSSLVALASVRVEGNDRLAVDEVLGLAGLELGTSVLRLPLGEAETALESHPLVADAVLSRDGALGIVVTVVEATPVLQAVDRRGRGSVLVARDGTVLAVGTAAGVLSATVAGPLPAPGEGLVGAPAVAAAHAVVVGLPGPLVALVVRVRADGPSEVDLELVTGETVRWGDEDRSDEKARALGAVLEDLGDRRVAVIDVRAPAAPTVTP